MTTAADIEMQAATWLMRQDAAGEHDEPEDLKIWLTADPRHRAAYLRLAAAWERSARLRMLRPDGGPADPNLLIRARSPSRWSPWRQRHGIAAGVLAVVIACACWIAVTDEAQTYRTEVGGLSRVVLKDGSVVTLNTDTELRVKFGKAHRQVELLRGEAQFVVTHDTTRPFEVWAGGPVVRAVGTAFDVRIDHGLTMEVIVTEGRVALVDTPSLAMPRGTATPTATISAGETAVATDGKVTVRRIAVSETSRHLAWQVGDLSFQGETMSEAVAEFNRYNRRKLKVEDPAIGSLRVGGNFRTFDLDSFVAALQRSFGITSRTAEDGSLILERAPMPVRDKQ